MNSLSSNLKEYSVAIVRLLKSTVNSGDKVWDDVLLYRKPIQEYVNVIGLELIIKENDGYAFLKQFPIDDDDNTIGLVSRKQVGFETSVLLYGPGVTLGVMRGFPKLGDAAFDGHLNFNARLQKFMDQGGKVYACRFALQALYGHGEKALMPGITPVNPLDVLDIVLMHRKEGAFILDTWTL